MQIKLDKFDRWQVIEIQGSVDALNSRLVTEPLLKIAESGALHVALNLGETSFLSLPAIKFIGNTARMLSAKGGELCVINPNERTKRHLEVFVGFRHLTCYENFETLISGSPIKVVDAYSSEFSQ